MSSDDLPASGAAPLVARSVSRSLGALPVLDGIDLEIGPGEVVALVGPSGCGKSTLLELVCGLQPADAGTVTARPAALMPQRDLLLPWLDARDNVALPLRIAGTGRKEARGRAQELLDHVDLGRFARSRPDQLSGGMRQRVAFLRALATDRELLCLDEPFGALDAITREELRAWLARLLDERPRGVLLVTHDVEEAVLLGDRVVVLSPRPARVTGTFAVEGARSGRDVADPSVLAARTAVRDALHDAIAAGRGGIP
ncbi:ABC transporter ATP-binding protein [Patulibacter minatonensis]|uniref:ABC transporter ATP-binding protein n=1 Tax=Patulibacter minatonensis TaxID=298163 RepID=UPI001FDF8E92|nr:ABC transporter ATP-binding protein [Patulibacter minatonensis]